MATTNDRRIKKLIPLINKYATFTPRDFTRMRGVNRIAHMPRAVPATNLPVDSTGNQTVNCPMDDNDKEGDCGEAMACHGDNILTYGQGKAGYVESVFSESALLAQYLAISGGDNGMSESMVVGPGGIWATGLAGNKNAVMDDALDFDCTNIPLRNYLTDQFYQWQMAWSVPDAFIQQFQSGMTFTNAMTPDPMNGHFTTQADVDVNELVTLWTWGGFCWAGPAFIASVQPQSFVVFSRRQFSLATGLDSKGRHIVTQAAKWVGIGGNQISQNVINMFPPLNAPPVVNPPPVVVPPVVNPIPVNPPPTSGTILTVSGSPLQPGTYNL